MGYNREWNRKKISLPLWTVKPADQGPYLILCSGLEVQMNEKKMKQLLFITIRVSKRFPPEINGRLHSGNLVLKVY